MTWRVACAREIETFRAWTFLWSASGDWSACACQRCETAGPCLQTWTWQMQVELKSLVKSIFEFISTAGQLGTSC